jgi:hypothetical protein
VALVRIIILLVILSSGLFADLATEVCPFCANEKQKSRVYAGLPCTRTQIPWKAYYDEGGQLHDDDPNYSICDYQCTRGHSYYRQLGPGMFIGEATLRSFLPAISTPSIRAGAIQGSSLTCSIDAAKFQKLKEAYMNCTRGNAIATTCSPWGMLGQLLEAVGCQ